MKFQIHQQRDGFRFWPVGTVEAQDKAAAIAEAERQHGPGKYVADLWHPPIQHELSGRGVSLSRSSLSSRR